MSNITKHILIQYNINITKLNILLHVFNLSTKSALRPDTLNPRSLHATLSSATFIDEKGDVFFCW